MFFSYFLAKKKKKIQQFSKGKSKLLLTISLPLSIFFFFSSVFFYEKESEIKFLDHYKNYKRFQIILFTAPKPNPKIITNDQGGKLLMLKICFLYLAHLVLMYIKKKKKIKNKSRFSNIKIQY